DNTITLANDEARRLLSLPADCVGRKVSQVLPQGRLQRFLTGGLKDEDEVLLAGDRVLVASRRAISVRGHEIGHVATLRDTTELTGLSRGMGVESLTEALRAQAHEFANRLHTIAGLVQLGRGEDAMKLIAPTSGLHQELTEALLDRVGDPVLGALLLAKAAVASERGIELRVSDDTVMTRSSLDSEDLITLLGNLIDNGLDAASASTGDRWVSVSVTEQDDQLVIRVHDSGLGIPDGVDGQIFQEGFSTKSAPGRKRRGSGLEVLQGLREDERPVDVISITAAREVESLRAAMRGGVVHYLIKPFLFATFEEKLLSYASARERMVRLAQAEQRDVDRIFGALRSATNEPLPEGLSDTTLDLIAQALPPA